MKLTVSEYSTQFKTSVQSVYQRIKRGTLKSVEENGVKYVIVEEESIKDDLNSEFKMTLERAFKTIEYLQNENKAMRKEIKRLTKALEKAQAGENQTLKEVFHELKMLKQLPSSSVMTQEEDVIEVKEDKSKKKKSKKKKKK